MQTNFLTDLLSTISNRSVQQSQKQDTRSCEELCQLLLLEIGDASAIKVARALLHNYRGMTVEDKRAFFRFLANDLYLDMNAIEQLARTYRESPTAANLSMFMDAAEPRRQELLRRLNRVLGATADLVSMRCDLFDAMSEEKDLARVDVDFGHLFSSWFNPGFLVLRRINSQTPANILEKIIASEAVHAITSWDELRRRVLPEDRQCYAYFHPCMPDEPLIFVEVALCMDVPGSIQAILSGNREIIPAEDATTAVFYSISNCQVGLRGVSFGNSLIKQVVEDLSTTLPQLTTFVTLSPIPGFRRWADKTMAEMAESEPFRLLLQSQLTASQPSGRDPANAEFRQIVAHYLANQTRKDQSAVDSVARFHLGNGAILHDVHSAADVSDNGFKQSYCAMVNYLYKPDKLEHNIEAFTTNKTVVKSKEINSLLKVSQASQVFSANRSN